MKRTSPGTMGDATGTIALYLCLVRPSSAHLGSLVWGVRCTEYRKSLSWDEETYDG
jgi:hypothetical protein